MNRFPAEARDGLMRAWLELLHEKHPGVTWVPVDPAAAPMEPIELQPLEQTDELANAS